jgi:hypothetical protein
MCGFRALKLNFADYGAIEQRVADALGAVERGLHAQVLARLDIDARFRR